MNPVLEFIEVEVVSELFHMFTRLSKLDTFHCQILIRDV